MLLLTNIRATVEYILNLFDITHITRVGQEFELFILNIYAFRYLCLPLSVCPCLFFSLSQNKKKKAVYMSVLNMKFSVSGRVESVAHDQEYIFS